ncbi:AI-2E family transporter [uncultured Faecalibaculum sp.]|uniref:AI-2E family transporter n=2 Tax=uncultured Faecalibaculum sp. TaxID=1729681 RepID=UPI0025E517B3|nr:AI-2E family transporter [uncultured Faecalibaculum sp.]
MKVEINRDMRRKIIIYSCSLAIAIILFTLINHLEDVMSFIGRGLSILGPFLFGIAIAFLMNKPMEWVEKQFRTRTSLKPGKCRLLAVLTVFLLLILFVFLSFAVVIPSLLDSIRQFMHSLTDYSETLGQYLNSLADMLGLSAKQSETLISQLDLFPSISRAVQQYLPRLADMGMDLVKFLMNVLISLAAAVYILLDKEKLLMGIRKLNYSLFSTDAANYLSLYSRDVQHVFEQYIVGNLIDSFIVGVITYIGCLLMGFPYAPMFAFVVGITNVIPVFGPFLGAIPVIIILLLIKPWYALLFAVFILVLQQVDGNVLKPIILGDKLGISGFWILFSVSVGGALFGILGMFLGVPVFALIYAGIRDLAEMRLREKNIHLEEKTGN